MAAESNGEMVGAADFTTIVTESNDDNRQCCSSISQYHNDLGLMFQYFSCKKSDI